MPGAIAQSIHLLNKWPFDASANEDEIIMVLNYIDIPSPQFKSCFLSKQMGDKGKTEGTVLKAKQRVFHFSATLYTLIKYEMNRGLLYYLRKGIYQP